MDMSLATLTALLLSALFVGVLTWRVEAGLACLLGVKLFEFTFGLNATVIGRLHLSATDIVLMGLLVAGAIRFVRHLGTVNAPRLMAAGYVVLFAWSFARGVSANGVLAAANEARGFVGPLAALLYFAGAAADEASMGRAVRIYLAFGAVLCVVLVLATLGFPVGTAASAHFTGDDTRLLPSNAAAAIAVCGFLALARATYVSSRISSLGLPWIFFIAAIDLRHRTVWMMLLAGIVALLFVDRPLFRRIVPIALLGSAVVAGLVLLAGDKEPGIASRGEFAQALSNAETWQWRVDSWQDFLFDADQTPQTILFGRPMGSGWGRIDPESHLLDSAPPHSEYVTEYLRVGLLGLVALVTFALRPLAIITRNSAAFDPFYPSTSIWAVIVLVTLVYGIPYSIEPELYAVLGFASALADGMNETQATFVQLGPDPCPATAPLCAH
jgi:hypothetical protein